MSAECPLAINGVSVVANVYVFARDYSVVHLVIAALSALVFISILVMEASE